MAVVMRQAHHDQQLCRYHNRNVKETSFNVGDLVLRRIQKTDSMLKLSAPWEGPIIKVISPSTHRLQWGDGKAYQTLGTWSIYDDSTSKIVFITTMYFLSFVPFFRLKNSSNSHLLCPEPYLLPSHVTNPPPRHARGLG
jgi:hypothetical protein